MPPEKKQSTIPLFIIVDTKQKRALYGINGVSLRFKTKETANEVAVQFFHSKEDFLIVELNNL